MAWQPVGGSVVHPDDELRCGTQRQSMKQNVLINKTELGKVKKTTFNHSSPDTIYGASMPPDEEGARAVISTWQEHVPNSHAKPGPDFKAMNRAAADSGLTSTQQIRSFRFDHPAYLKTGAESVAQKPGKLPSDKDPTFTYGKPATYRSAEDCRNFGPEEPKAKELIQGAYSNEWVDKNLARQDEFDVHKKYIKPAPTTASEGHHVGAMRTMAKVNSDTGSPKSPSSPSGGWKMPKFEKHAQPKVTQYMTGSPTSKVEQIHR